jgi:hypothetical protein
VAFLALLSVAPLLAWVYGVGSFAAWYWRLAFPSVVAVVVWTVWARRSAVHTDLTRAVRVGAVGGLLGTVGYDLVRIPVELSGTRVFAPIDSYGVLLIDGLSSSPWSGLAGWAFHTTNGVCFGIAFALVATRRPIWWAVAWAMVLESAAVFSPFADRYGLHGKLNIIAIAYGAHVAYGIPLGWACRDPEHFERRLDEVSRRTATGMLLGTGVALILWHRPWSTPEPIEAGERVAAGPSAILRDGDLSPLWLRVGDGECAVVRNDDKTVHTFDRVGLEVAPGQSGELCLTGAGVHRVRVDDEAHSGGFVIVDPEQ